jgi:AcrR family transcriptional regulator
MFGKPGRPPEDRLGRQRQIWTTVGPLIEEHGVGSLTMRQAADASFMSLGGLYHYFPNKRALVLFGLDQAALERECADFYAEHGHLKETDPDAAVEAFIQFSVGERAFCRPAVLAALELGATGRPCWRPPTLSVRCEAISLRASAPPLPDPSSESTTNSQTPSRPEEERTLAGPLPASWRRSEGVRLFRDERPEGFSQAAEPGHEGTASLAGRPGCADERRDERHERLDRAA